MKNLVNENKITRKDLSELEGRLHKKLDIVITEQAAITHTLYRHEDRLDDYEIRITRLEQQAI